MEKGELKILFKRFILPIIVMVIIVTLIDFFIIDKKEAIATTLTIAFVIGLWVFVVNEDVRKDKIERQYYHHLAHHQTEPFYRKGCPSCFNEDCPFCRMEDNWKGLTNTLKEKEIKR
jgi:c-di-AMP phosphodiesterase-like protein